MATKFLGGIDLQAARATNAADPSSATDLATKQYVDNFVNGLSFKEEVKAATTTNGTLATAYAAGQSVDGQTLVTGWRILIKNQTTQTENGIYTVNATGAPTRALDADSATDLDQATVRVVAGTTNGNTQWTQTTAEPVVGTSNIVFASSGAGAAYTAADDTINITSNAVKVNPKSGGGLTHDGTTGLAIDTTFGQLAKRYAADCAATTNPQTFTHSLGTNDVDVTVYIKSTGEIVIPSSITISSTNAISVDFGGAPTAAQYRVVICA